MSTTNSSLATGFPPLVLAHIAHELRLQLLRAPLSAYVQGALLHRQFLVPGGKKQYRRAVVGEGGPHEPPAVAGTFQQSAIRTCASIIGIGNDVAHGHHNKILYPRDVSH